MKLKESCQKNSRQCQNKIDQQEAQIKSLQNQNQQLQGLLDPKLLVSAISQAVTTGLKLGSQLTSKGGMDSKGIRFMSKPYLGKPRLSQLAPGTDISLNLELEWRYCKDTGHLKENCIKLNHQLAMKQKFDQRLLLLHRPQILILKQQTRLLCLRTRAGEEPIVVQRSWIQWKMY